MGLYINGYQGSFNPTSIATIASGQTTSGEIACGGFDLCGIQMPAALTGTQISFVVSSDGVTFQPLHSSISGTLLTYTVVQGTFSAIDPKDFFGVNYFKIVSNASEAAARSLVCALKGF